MLSSKLHVFKRRCGFHTSRAVFAEDITRAAADAGHVAVTTKLNKDQLKRREIRRLAKRRSDAKKPATSSPLHMPVDLAVRYLRAIEVGKPLSQQTIGLTTLFIAEKGSPNLSGNISFSKPLKEVKIAVFSNDEEQIKIAREKFNCYLAGGPDLIAKIKNGQQAIDFDKAFATPDIVPELSNQLARVLGPRGVFPSAKKGTVASDISSLIQDSMGSIPFRQLGNSISIAVGNCSFTDKQILENIIATRAAFKTALSNQKTKKPSLLSKTVLTTSHGPGIVIDFS